MTQVRVNDTEIVSLASLPSAGYRWTVPQQDGVSVSHKFVPLNESTHVVGSGGFDVFSLKFYAPGVYELVFSYGRCWEDAPQEEKRFVYAVSE